MRSGSLRFASALASALCLSSLRCGLLRLRVSCEVELAASKTLGCDGLLDTMYKSLEICARSRRALLRDALAGERSADVVARLRDRVDGHARAGTPREDADDEDVE